MDEGIRRALDRQSQFAEQLAAEPGDNNERLVKLDDQVVGRVRHIDTHDGAGGGDFGWVAEYWNGQRFEQWPATLLAESDDLDEAGQIRDWRSCRCAGGRPRKAENRLRLTARSFRLRSRDQLRESASDTYWRSPSGQDRVG
jgi:hypothetical protein